MRQCGCEGGRICFIFISIFCIYKVRVKVVGQDELSLLPAQVSFEDNDQINLEGN